MSQWHSSGAPKDKLMVGIPFYGRSFTLADEKVNGPGARATKAGKKGPYTEEEGFLSYYEVIAIITYEEFF